MLGKKEEIRMADLLFGQEVEDELDKLSLSKKTKNCLIKAGITTLIEVFELNEKRLSAIPHMTKTMSKEITDKVTEYLANNVHKMFNRKSHIYDDDFE